MTGNKKSPLLLPQRRVSPWKGSQEFLLSNKKYTHWQTKEKGRSKPALSLWDSTSHCSVPPKFQGSGSLSANPAHCSPSFFSLSSVSRFSASFSYSSLSHFLRKSRFLVWEGNRVHHHLLHSLITSEGAKRGNHLACEASAGN